MNHPITEAREPKNSENRKRPRAKREMLEVIKGLVAWRLEFSPQTSKLPVFPEAHVQEGKL